jgi:hypothetical protein
MYLALAHDLEAGITAEPDEFVPFPPNKPGAPSDDMEACVSRLFRCSSKKDPCAVAQLGRILGITSEIRDARSEELWTADNVQIDRRTLLPM